MLCSVSQGINDCDFEKDLCGWTQAKGDNFDWTRAQSPQGTVQTGPTYDHTTTTSEYFSVLSVITIKTLTTVTQNLINFRVESLFLLPQAYKLEH